MEFEQGWTCWNVSPALWPLKRSDKSCQSYMYTKQFVHHNHKWPIALSTKTDQTKEIKTLTNEPWKLGHGHMVFATHLHLLFNISDVVLLLLKKSDQNIVT